MEYCIKFDDLLCKRVLKKKEKFREKKRISRTPESPPNPTGDPRRKYEDMFWGGTPLLVTTTASGEDTHFFRIPVGARRDLFVFLRCSMLDDYRQLCCGHTVVYLTKITRKLLKNN